ncbi:Endopolyphosphatase [Emydomyces testavorans]|uniref:Endopolyphosphatase n=1 Tax=Emydomyces testavorans TaxID=2070801 RepID=A0AAF0IGK1_9EURO|nr:Endopolyphosphatase [Emydomyces testavorans]
MAKCLWIISALVVGISGVTGQRQSPLQLAVDGDDEHVQAQGPHKLHGRFLHITDIHPDPYYKAFSKSDSKRECHRGKGDAGYFGSAGSSCDSPFALVNATFKWIEDNLSDSIDFVLWTGDSARHDNDERNPRTKSEVASLNQAMVDKFFETFSDKRKGVNRLRIPVVPTIGNNDVMPHNILKGGPNSWTRTYADMWSKFIPEEQRHSFVEGGWFYVEVIPKKLAVFSLNTMYFFDSNNAVDGCDCKSDPGYEHMEWLRIQLQFIRDRNMKAILIGHVPPARTDSKTSWDETCWQKYSLWLKQYRDVIVGSVFGHMNIDHFMLHDFHDLEIGDQESGLGPDDGIDSSDEITTQSRTAYLRDLRALWAKLPSPPSMNARSPLTDHEFVVKPTVGKSEKKYLQEMGGKWAERYAVSLVSPSVIPTYFPTLRVIEYNVSGLDSSELWFHRNAEVNGGSFPGEYSDILLSELIWGNDTEMSKKKGRKKKHKKKKKPPKFTIPMPPSSTAPPGPAYSNQPFTWLGYTQYFANITKINSRFERTSEPPKRLLNWREYLLQKAEDNSGNGPFEFEVEYNTTSDEVFQLKDMTVKSYLKLARKIARSPELTQIQSNCVDDRSQSCEGRASPGELDLQLENAGSHGFDESERDVRLLRKNAWKIFLHRAFVGYFDEAELRDLIGGV